MTNKIEMLLSALPESAGEIAALLALQGIRGEMDSISHCPLAVYLQRGGVDLATVGRYTAAVASGRVALPDGCVEFVKGFDLGEYPNLEARQ